MFNTTDEEEEKQDDQDNDDRSINLEKTDDEDEYAKYVHNDEYVHDYADEEMKDVENAETGKDDDEVNNAIKADVKKIEEAKRDNKQAGNELANVDQAKDTSAQDNQATAPVSVTPKEMHELSPTSSNQSIFSGFEVPQIQSPTLLNVPVSVIPKQPVPVPSPALTTETHVSTVLSHPSSVTTFTPIQQQTTLIPTPPITTVAPSVTTTVPNPLPTIVLRFSVLESQFEEWK
ncbi:hypothetical protein Tco_1418613 [Tanacetum coccineum]